MNKKTATALSLASVLGVSAAVGAGTYAAFSDTETAAAQRISAGTLDLGEGTASTVAAEGTTVGNLAPGQAISDQTVAFDNASSIPGSLTVTFTVPDAGAACDNENEAAAEDVDFPGACANDLDDQTNVTVMDGEDVAYTGTVAGLRTASYERELAAEEGFGLVFSYTFADSDDNNAAQGDSFAITTNASLVS